MNENQELREKLFGLKTKGHFVFVPFGRLPTVNGLFIPVSERVIMDEIDFYQVQGSFGLRHFAFMKLADAAGVHWSAEGAHVGRTDNMSNPNYCSFRVVAKIRTPEGLWTEQSASKHLDLDAKREAIEIKHSEAFDYKNKFGGGKGPNGWPVKKPWPKGKDEYVKKFTSRDVNQLRDNMDERCESGAQSRAIKNLIHIPASFPADKKNDKIPACLGMEFHIVRYILDPLNPRVQQAQLDSFHQAITGIYGIPAPAPVKQIEEPRDVTPTEKEDVKEEETEEPDNFVGLSFGEKIKAIEALVKSSGYDNYENDTKKTPLKDWTDKQLIGYYEYLLAEEHNKK
jgi:hypothetical protein